MISIESVCGCTFAIVPGAEETPTVLRLQAGDVTFTREIRVDWDGEMEEFASFLHSCVLAVEDDAREGEHHMNLCDRGYYCEDLGLETELEVTDLSGTVVRLRLTVLLPDDAPLGLCHVGVVLDVSLHQLRTFVADLVAALPTRPQWWFAA